METPSLRRLRIGELSRRTGVGIERLRAWERRYGLIVPERSPAGYRLYSEEDERRVLRMCEELARGLAPAEAARMVTGAAGAPATGPPVSGVARASGTSDPPAPPAAPELARLGGLLGASLRSFDESGAQRALDALLAGFSLETVLRDAALPALRGIGSAWERGELGVGHEHFASAVVGARMFALARGWDSGDGPLAVLACPPGERHHLGLVAFGLALHRRGWRIAYLGADTPVEALAATVTELRAALTVVAGTLHEPLAQAAGDIGRLAERSTLACGGAAAGRAIARRMRARLLEGDPVTAAQHVA